MHPKRQHRRCLISTTNRRDHQTVHTPALDRSIHPRIKGCESIRITLCQVRSTQRITSILRELLTDASIGWSILSHDCDEPIGIRLDRVNDLRIIIRPSSDDSRSRKRREELLEGRKGDGGDLNPSVEGIPCVDGTR